MRYRTELKMGGGSSEQIAPEGEEGRPALTVTPSEDDYSVALSFEEGALSWVVPDAKAVLSLHFDYMTFEEAAEAVDLVSRHLRAWGLTVTTDNNVGR